MNKVSQKDDDDSFKVFHSKVYPRYAWIEAELKGRPLSPWEGKFTDGNGFCLSGWIISGKAGYVSLSKLVDMGNVEAREDRIKLLSESPVMGKKTIELLVVRWGDRVYLVEPSHMIGFCNHVNSGWGVRNQGGFYMRVDDIEKKVAGLPAVTSEYREYLLKEPLEAKIQKIGSYISDVIVPGLSYPVSGHLITLAAGKQNGFRLGMELYHKTQLVDLYTCVYIVLLAEKSCIALLHTVKDAQIKLFAEGTSLSTRDPSRVDK